MTVGDAAATALTTYLTEKLTLASTVDNGLRADLVTEFDNRVVVVADTANLRLRFVPGLYDVTGRVLVQQSIDTANALTSFRALTEEVRALMEDKENMPSILTTPYGGLKVHSYNFLEQDAAQSERGFQTIFNWAVFAELPH